MTEGSGPFRSARTLVLAGCFVVWMGGACPAVAQEGPPVPPSPVSTPQEGPPVPPPSPVSTSQEGPPVPASPEPTPSEKLVEEKAPDVVMAVDKSLARLEQSILDRVIRFGNFFGSAKDEDARHPDYLIRWVNSLRMEEGGNFKYRTSARASFVLPKISNRLRLTVSGRPRPNPFLQGSRRTRGTRASIELSRRPALPIRSFATA